MNNVMQAKLDEILETLYLTKDAFKGNVQIKGQDPIVASPHHIGDSTAILLALFGMEISSIWEKRTNQVEDVNIDVDRAVVQLASIFYNKQNGVQVPYEDLGLVETTDFFECKDGRWVYIVCSTPSLRQKTCSVLKTEATHKAFSKACLEWNAMDLEKAILAVDGAIAMVRSREEWKSSEQYKHTMRDNLIQIDKLTKTKPTPFTPNPQRPLSGVKIIDNTHILAGPLCGRYMADAGAEVLRILPPHYTNPVAMEMETIGGKHSAWLNLKDEDKRNVFFDLIKEADVFINSYLNMESMGITPEKLHSINPSLIYVDFTAYGTSGPWKTHGGFEQHGQSVTGFSSNEGSMDEPINPPTYLLNDVMCAIEASIGIVDTLQRRETEGGGFHIRVSLSRNCDWVQEFGLFDRNDLNALPKSVLDNPGLAATLRDEFKLPTITTPHGPLGEMTFLPLQIDFSNLKLHPTWSGEPNGASKPMWVK